MNQQGVPAGVADSLLYEGKECRAELLGGPYVLPSIATSASGPLLRPVTYQSMLIYLVSSDIVRSDNTDGLRTVLLSILTTLFAYYSI